MFDFLFSPWTMLACWACFIGVTFFLGEDDIDWHSFFGMLVVAVIPVINIVVVVACLWAFFGIVIRHVIGRRF